MADYVDNVKHKRRLFKYLYILCNGVLKRVSCHQLDSSLMVEIQRKYDCCIIDT